MIKEPQKHVIETHEQYLSKKDFLSASMLKKIKICPKVYKWHLDNPDEHEETKSLIVGTAMHTFLLEKDKFNDLYICLKKDMLPEADKDGNKTYRSKKNREFRDSFQVNNPNKIVLSEDDYDLVVGSCTSVINDKPLISKMLQSENGERVNELSMYGIDEKTGIALKGRTDNLPNEKYLKSALLDVKSCEDARPFMFQKTIYNYGYDIQAAQYSTLFDRDNFVFLAIEKKQPFISSLFLISGDSMRVCKENWRMCLDILHWSNERNFYADYNEFAILKEIYQRNLLYSQSVESTLSTLDDFFEIKKNTLGITELNITNNY